MKKQILSSVKKSILSLGFTGLVLFGLATTASAGTTDSTPNPAVKYVGSLDGQPVFKVDLNNESAKIQYLTIKDDQGVVLYSEKIKSKQFSKSFKFETTDRDVKLTFIVENEKGAVQSQEFKVNTNTRVYNDVVVTTL